MNLYSPLEIFEINLLAGTCKIFFSSHNLEIFITLSFLAITLLMSLRFRKIYFMTITVISWKFLYNFILNMFKDNIYSLRSHKFFPTIFSLLFFIFVLNITGLVFFDVTITSHIFMTLFLSFSFFISFFFNAIFSFDISYVHKFIESNINIFLKIILFFIELISFLIRPLSLGIRLFTNMLSGHVLLHIFISFLVYVNKNYIYTIVFPLVIIFAIFALEIFISFIQTYVFMILSIIYLKDMYEIHS